MKGYTMIKFRSAAARLPTLLVLTGAIAIVQWHSIAFWSGQINPTIGWLWSVALEAAALWLWYRKGWGYALLGAGASLLLLAGPLVQTASPILDAGLEAVHADAARGALIVSQEQAVRSAEAQLDTVLANSQAAPKWQRTQWIASIGTSQRRADEARAELGHLVAQSPRSGEVVELRRRAVIAMQALALIVLQVMGILCITSLRARVAPGAPAAPIIVRRSGPSEATDALLPQPKRVQAEGNEAPEARPGLDGLLDQSRLGP